MRRVVPVLVLIAFVGGCASGKHTKPVSQKNAVTTDVKTYVLDGLLIPLDPPGGDPTKVQFANVIPDAAVTRGVAMTSTLLPIFGVAETVGGVSHAYVALVGPNPGLETESESSISASEPALLLAQGWVLLSGGYPISQTDWVRGTAEGTSFILRRMPVSGGGVQITGYNVTPPGGHRVLLRRTSDGAERWLDPGQQLTVPQSGVIPVPIPFAETDAEFLEYVKALAASAGITLN